MRAAFDPLQTLEVCNFDDLGAVGSRRPEHPDVAQGLNNLAGLYYDHLTRRDIFKQNRSAALAEWRQLAA